MTSPNWQEGPLICQNPRATGPEVCQNCIAKDPGAAHRICPEPLNPQGAAIPVATID